ncbi:MAG: TolC family protein [Nitrospiraceae bacterium]|nr:TolC family protein [Nitrospiraceae bacterium]
MSAIILVVLFTAPEVNPQVAYAQNEELRTYLQEAGQNHPGLRMRYEEWLASLERIPQAKALDDPMLSYGQFLQSETLRFKAMVSQKFPWFGTRRVRGEKAAVEAEAALARLHAERNRVFANVKRAYFDYAYLGESIWLVESQDEILKYVEDTAQSQYSLGLVGQEDVLRAQIMRTKLRDRLDGLVASRAALSARLDETMGTEPAAERPWPQAAGFPPAPPDDSEVLARTRAANPELTVFDKQIEGRRKQAVLARKKGYPDITLGLEYMGMRTPDIKRPDRPYPATLNAANRTINTLTGAMPFNGATAAIDLYSLGTAREPIRYPDRMDDNIAVSLSFNLPIWRKKIRAGVAEAELLEKAATYGKRRTTLALERAVHQTLYELRDAQRRHALYRDSLLPQAQMTYETLQSGYAVGMPGAGFLDILGSVQILLDFELEQHRAARDWQVAAAELEFLMGGTWPGADVE